MHTGGVVEIKKSRSVGQTDRLFEEERDFFLCGMIEKAIWVPVG